MFHLPGVDFMENIADVAQRAFDRVSVAHGGKDVFAKKILENFPAAKTLSTGATA